MSSDALLVTDRFTLRRPTAADGPALGEAISEALDELTPWFAWARPLARFRSPADCAVRAEVLEARNRSGLETGWLVWRGDEVLGEIVLRNEGLPFGVVTYHVWVRPSAAGTGVATEASLAALDHAFSGAQVEWVEAECAAANFRSRRLLTRLGFERYGSTRDHERYVLRAFRRT